MGWHTSKSMIAARNLARNLGLTRLVRRLGYTDAEYEQRFDQLLLSRIEPGDCVWDVGANIGHYSRRFLDRLGREGAVFAFEPSPDNRRRLLDALGATTQVTIRPEALGAQPGRVAFVQGDDSLGATSHLAPDQPADDGVEVEVACGDDLIASGKAAQPTAIKIDTEGFELEVLTGLEQALRAPLLHTVGVEVHFAILARRGLPDAPKAIELLLQRSGLQTRWVDASHVVGLRRGAEA